MERTRTVPMTPWVTRLLALNGAVFLLLATVFTAPRFLAGVAFDPSALGARPWTVVSFLAASQDLVQLVLTSLILYLFGPLVERRLGGRRFVAYYLYCGIGAALVALCLSGLLAVNPLLGASGAAYGVGLAFVLGWPNTPVNAFHVPVAARSLFLGLLVTDLVFGVTGAGGLAQAAHLGGIVAGYVFFRVQLLAARQPDARPVPVRRPVVTPMRVQEAVADLRAAAPMAEAGETSELSTDAIDRVLDKISESGLDSLTSQERRLLDDAAERKRREQS